MIESETPPVFNPADYPRKYVYATPRLDWAVGYFIVMACFFAATYVLTYHYLRNPLPGDFVFLSYMGLIAGLIVAILMVHENEIELTRDAIAMKKDFFRRHMLRQDIMGWEDSRIFWEDKDSIELVPFRSSVKSLSISKDAFEQLECDNYFHAWYKSLPDLGQKKKDEYYDAIANTVSLGGTREARLKNMEMLVKWLGWFHYLSLGLLVYISFIPNAYLLPLSEPIAIALVVLTILSILIIYKYPILLFDPPLGLRKKQHKFHFLVSLWGCILFIWFMRDSLLNQAAPDLFKMSLNIFMVGIFLLLCLPLLADIKWEQMPRRLLSEIFCILMATAGFYFYGNMTLDRAEPIIQSAIYEEHAFGNPDSKTPYAFANNDGVDGREIEGCEYTYPGAFGTPWGRYSPCPENFQIPEKSK